MKLTKKNIEWLDRIRAAGGLIKHYNERGNEEYFVLNTQKRPSSDMIKRMLKMKVLLAAQDGFFGDSQSFKPAPHEIINEILDRQLKDAIAKRKQNKKSKALKFHSKYELQDRERVERNRSITPPIKGLGKVRRGQGV